MPSTEWTFSSATEHRAHLSAMAELPRGFRVGVSKFEFTPREVAKLSTMKLTVIAMDKPTESFAAMFTRNAFPGAPVLIGRRRLNEASIGAVVVNNKVSNVGAEAGGADAERVCAELAKQLQLSPTQVIPCSTGVIGWRLPVAAMLPAIPETVAALSAQSVLPAAEGIMTTDLYPKLRRARVGNGSIVGIAKGAGMIEPNLATMLVFILTDLDVPRDALRAALHGCVEESFNNISIDTDTSTSDTVIALSSNQVPCPDLTQFRLALKQVCQDLAEDVVRNGEGVHHVMRVKVRGAPSLAIARGIGKAVVSSPLVQCAVCGNDPNVGRLIAAIGKFLGAQQVPIDLGRLSVRMGGHVLFEKGAFQLSREKEELLIQHLRGAELYASVAPADGMTFVPPVRFPPHERAVEIEIDLGIGQASAEILGSDRSHEYISENADYRS